MFERFPQLKRLERILSKAQTYSPKKSKSPPPCQEKAVSSMAISQEKVQENQSKMPYLTTVDSASDVHHSEHQPLAEADTKRFFGTDDKSESKQSIIVKSHQNKGRRMERRRLWTTALRSPRDMLRSRNSSRRTRFLDRPPVAYVEQDRASVPRPPIKRIFFKEMQEQPASDGLSVLSEEEVDDQESDSQTLRYPLPTMPLSIMVPVEDLPDYIVPMDFHSMMNKSSRLEPNLAALMESRNRLASSYTLFDDLCTSFRGQDNLERFLRSLLAAGSYPANDRSSPPPRETQHPAKEPQSNPSSPWEGVTSSVGSSCTASCTTSTTSHNESRLMRLTVSTRMKRVEPIANKPKRVMAADSSTDCSAYGGYGLRPLTNQVPHGNARSPAKRANKPVPTPPPLSEEEAREEMMYRVRRGLLNLPWILRRRSSSFSRISHDHSLVAPPHGYMTACIS